MTKSKNRLIGLLLAFFAAFALFIGLVTQARRQ